MKRFDQRNAFAEACPMCLPASHSLKIKNCWAHKRFTISILSAISIQLFQMASFFFKPMTASRTIGHRKGLLNGEVLGLW